MISERLRFAPYRLPAELDELRARVRAFLRTELEGMEPVHLSNGWDGFDPEFSAKLGAAGFIGLTLPSDYGGHGQSALERYVVVEECLAMGAPTGFHWIADRQSGPLIARYGSEAAKRKIIPEITAGRACFGIGMSEPNAGSDLAALRSRAERNGDAWVLNGQKIWTTSAHRADYMIALMRTDPEPETRHGGLSQFVIDLQNTPGVTIRPIKDLTGREHFNEIFFDNAELPADGLIGTEGEGWRQVTEELAFERSGPERYMSCMVLLSKLIDLARESGRSEIAGRLGMQVAWLATLRSMSISVAGKLAAGEDPALEASVVKDLGCEFEQNLPGLAQELIELAPTLAGHGIDYQQVLGNLMQLAPAFSLRGGTPEILKGIIARGLGLR